jgi:hypothetical protein
VAVTGLVAFVCFTSVLGRLLSDRGVPIHAGAEPLQGRWELHVGPGTLLAPLVALCVVFAARNWIWRASWPTVLAGSVVASAVWIVSLALVDGPQRGYLDRLTRPDEYLHDLPRVVDVSAFLSTFSSSISIDSADPWTTHVASHPPGTLLAFWLLARAGLSGGLFAASFCVLVGASAIGAAMITVRTLAGEGTARRLAPFLVLTPMAIWVGVSGDALFMGASAWAIALVALACRATSTWRTVVLGLGAGLLLGVALYLSYGLLLIVIVVLAVVAWYGRAAVGALLGVGVVVVVAAFTVAGFRWWEGSALVVDRYYAGWGSERPYWFWVWANLVVLTVQAGPAAFAGVRRVLAAVVGDPRAAMSNPSTRAVTVLVGSALAAVLLATVGGLSKAEVERIWLPFALWVTVSCASLPERRLRPWLWSQVGVAMLVQHLIFTTW